jgi:hypothetical protein
MVPPLPAASRPSKRMTTRSPHVFPVLQFEQFDLQEPLVPVVLGPGYPLVVGIALPPGVHRCAVRVELDRVVVMVVDDPVAGELVLNSGRVHRRSSPYGASPGLTRQLNADRR